MAQSIVTAEARAAIGTVVARKTGTVYAKEFQRWAAAVGDLNPLYFDSDYAKAHGYEDIIMPPLFLRYVMNDVSLLSDLRADGLSRKDSIDLPLPERRMTSGEETHFFRPAYPGDVLTSVQELADIEEKHGRSGAFALVTWKTTYRNQEGEMVAEALGSMIAR